jgi:Flp pilus assembly protein TadD
MDSPAKRRDDGRQALLGGAVVAVATVIAYANSFGGPFVFDDEASIVDNASIRHLGSALFTPANATVSGRPLLNLSLAVNYAISGGDVWSYHALNLAIHVLAALALLGIVRRTLAGTGNPAATAIATSVALLWSVHPLLTESVTYVVQRAESLMGLCYLLTLYCMVRAAAAAPARGTAWLSLCVVACLLGMATKEVMVTAPLVVLLYDRTFLAGSFAGALRARWRAYCCLAATWLLLLVLVFSTRGRSGSAGFGSGIAWWRYALTQVAAVTHYLRQCVWPRWLVFDYGSVLVTVSRRLVAESVILAGMIGGTAWALARRPWLGFLAASFFMILAPSSSVVPVSTQTIAEHRMYLPLIPVVVLGVLGIFLCARRAAFPVCFCLAACLAAATWNRNETYRSDLVLWSDTVSKVPGNSRAHNNVGNDLRLMPGRLDDALAQYEEALRRDPGDAEAHNNLGVALESVPGRMGDAISHLREALRLSPEYADAHYNLANALDAEGLDLQAVDQYRDALRIRPDLVGAHVNLGIALSSLGRSPEAVAEYGEALKLSPHDPVSLFNLGLELAKMPGQSDAAAASLREVLSIQPGNAAAQRALENVELGRR